VASGKFRCLPKFSTLKRRNKLENSNSELGMTFSEHVGYILLEETSEQEKINELKTLFLGSDIPLVSSVVGGHTTFNDTFRPLMLEYNNLKLTSLLTDACMSEEFILKGKKLREEASQVIRLGFNMVSIKNGYGQYCDITLPLSRGALVKETYSEMRSLLKLYLFVVLLFASLQISGIPFPKDSLVVLEVGFYFITALLSITFCISLYKNYMAAYILRRDACTIVYLQVMKLDEIAYNLFFASK
jgi:hypothetical protein